MRWVKLVLICSLLSGCGITTPMKRSEKKLLRIETGMRQEEVIKKLGRPDSVRASTKLSEDLIYKVHEYYLFPPSDSWRNLAIGPFMLTLTWWIPSNGFTGDTVYWLHYINNELRYWGREGDWSGAPKEIIEIRQTSGDKINLK